ncbi:MAG: DUF4392 domain-containing protein [Gemmataceae bacterium]|nr:DUF4392 domain-containing protein [Gemmataceae bacterium]
MSDPVLDRMRELAAEDVGERGIATVPERNLVTECASDFAPACRSIAETANAHVGIVTGFWIPSGQPPAGETDGPLGALFLARALIPLGIRVSLLTDDFCSSALAAGLTTCGLGGKVRLLSLPTPQACRGMSATAYADAVGKTLGPVTHLIAVERPGPTHTIASLQAQLGAEAIGETLVDFLHDVPEELQDRCRTMRGFDISPRVSPVHFLFERTKAVTIGIGDGGNEIGMGKLTWDLIRANVPGGGAVACRVPTSRLIVAGVSNWGAYALAAGVAQIRGKAWAGDLSDAAVETRLLKLMVEKGPLVDGRLGKPAVSVDGIPLERYLAILSKLAALVRGGA